jgi:hypothetical protein
LNKNNRKNFDSSGVTQHTHPLGLLVVVVVVEVVVVVVVVSSSSSSSL